jgi:hypothetical protein
MNDLKKKTPEANLRPAHHRAGASWIDERNTDRGNIRVEQAMSSMRAEKVYDSASDCQGCVRARAETDDEQALCEEHLAAALGMA